MAAIADIEQRLGVDLSGVVPHFYSDGATDATVFNLADKYLVKITDLNRYSFPDVPKSFK